jgi:hypothetical protein
VRRFGVVEGFDVVEDGGAELAAAWPGVAEDEFLLERREEALGNGVVLDVACRAHRDRDASVAGGLAEPSETYWLPWSESWTSLRRGKQKGDL